jgi:SAM-dependent methyltransferase
MQKFGFKETRIDRKLMDARILSAANSIGFRLLVRYMQQLGKSMDDFSIAEIGCGTGTFSLLFNFLGVQTTLIDADEAALEAARTAFSLYGRSARFLKADVLSSVPEDLSGKFDIVVSGGLAEHFSGKDRQKCILFHRMLLKSPGLAFISVPNALGPFYRIVTGFRKITGTWDMEIEIPYSFLELRENAYRAGFSRSEIFGNQPLLKDFGDYALGFGSAMLAVFPAKVKNAIRKRLHRPIADKEEEKDIPVPSTQSVVSSVLAKASPPYRKAIVKTPKDYLSSGITLFGYLGN